MATNALVQTRIDSGIRDRAASVHEGMGLTASDTGRLLLTRTAHERALPAELISNSEAHDAWFRAKVMQALEDTRPDSSAEDVEAHFASRREAALHKAGATKS